MNLDPAKLVVILLVALIVLGPERLPRAARQMGAVWHELSRIRDQVTDEVRSAFPTEELPRIPNASRAISGFLDGMRETVAGANGSTASQPPRAPGSPGASPARRDAEGAVFGVDDPGMN